MIMNECRRAFDSNCAPKENKKFKKKNPPIQI